MVVDVSDAVVSVVVVVGGGGGGGCWKQVLLQGLYRFGSDVNRVCQSGVRGIHRIGLQSDLMGMGMY